MFKISFLGLLISIATVSIAIGTVESQTAGLTFRSFTGDVISINAVPYLCSNRSYPRVTGPLISYLNLSAQLISEDLITSAFAAIANQSVILVLPRVALQGYFPPFFNDLRSIQFVFEKILSWKVGAIIVSDLNEVPGFSDRRFLTRNWCWRSPIPILEVWQDELDKSSAEIGDNILESDIGLFGFSTANNTNQQPLLATVDSTANVNRWIELRNSGGMIAWRVLMTLIAAATSSIAGAKLIAYFRTTGFVLSVGQVVLWIQLMFGLYRTCYAAIDPIFMGYTDMAGFQASILVSFHFPANTITLLLLALYWKELLDQKKVVVAAFISRMRIPFGVVSFIAVAGELVSTSLRATEVASLVVVSLVSGLIYLIISLLVTLVFFIFGIQVILRMRNSAKMTSSVSTKTKQRLRKTTAYVMVAGVLSFFWFIGNFGVNQGRPESFISSWTLQYFSVYVGALSHVVVVRFPSSNKPTPVPQSV